jgi:hypothetical protein
MVVYTPLPPLPVTPETPYDYLDFRIDGMSIKLDEIMAHFRAATPAGTTVPPTAATASPRTPAPASRRESYAAAASPQVPHVSPDTSLHQPVLVPTPNVQGPPPPVASSTAELIGDHNPAIRLTYMPRSHTSNCWHTTSRPLQESNFCTSKET